jgi:preprotein translocase subunit SecD
MPRRSGRGCRAQGRGSWLKLGLDLQGGMHLVLEVDDPDGHDDDEAKADMIDRIDRIIRTRIDEFGVEEPLIQKVGDDRLIVELAGISDEEQAKEIVQRNAFLEFKLVRPTTDIEQALSRIDRADRRHARRRLDPRDGA